MPKSSYPKTKSFIFLTCLLIASLTFIFAMPASQKKVEPKPAPVTVELKTDKTQLLYDSLHLDALSLSREAFTYAIQGLNSLQEKGALKNDSILSIVDFSLPSTKKRLFIINLSKGELLYNTYVSHGRNSGKVMATRFSNKPNSFASSLGFYVTGETYKGQHGYSLRLLGMEKGINDNALSRGIVMHSADYVNERLIKSQGYIGRSLGCPAVSPALHKEIIGTIKEGSCLFLYSPDEKYTVTSKLLGEHIS